MTPDHLRARTAAWSLWYARDVLTGLVTDEARDRLVIDEVGLRSPIWGARHALGGHGDPVADRILHLGHTGPGRYATLAADITGRLARVARHLPGGGEPLTQIMAALPGVSAFAAIKLTTLLRQLDDRVRRDLRMEPSVQLVPRAACPDCHTRARLVLHPAMPVDQQTVSCQECDSIWPRAEVLGPVTVAA